MDFDEPGWPMIDAFFSGEAAGRSAPTVRRYARVRRRLLTFLDSGDMTLGLGSHPAALLDAERQFHDTGAFWALFGVGELVCCLPSFLHETWMPDSLGEAGTQVSLVGRLLRHVGRDPSVDWTVFRCAFWEAEAAVTRARAELADRRAAGVDEVSMPDRFRQPPGPQW